MQGIRKSALTNDLNNIDRIFIERNGEITSIKKIDIDIIFYLLQDPKCMIYGGFISFAVFGIACSQKCCIGPPISKKLPCVRWI